MYPDRSPPAGGLQMRPHQTDDGESKITWPVKAGAVTLSFCGQRPVTSCQEPSRDADRTSMPA